jgi:hypothetical protein
VIVFPKAQVGASVNFISEILGGAVLGDRFIATVFLKVGNSEVSTTHQFVFRMSMIQVQTELAEMQTTINTLLNTLTLENIAEAIASNNGAIQNIANVVQFSNVIVRKLDDLAKANAAMGNNN